MFRTRETLCFALAGHTPGAPHCTLAPAYPEASSIAPRPRPRSSHRPPRHCRQLAETLRSPSRTAQSRPAPPSPVLFCSCFFMMIQCNTTGKGRNRTQARNNHWLHIDSRVKHNPAQHTQAQSRKTHTRTEKGAILMRECAERHNAQPF